jgi:hypothetical protein
VLLIDKGTVDYYRCPEVFAQFELSKQPDATDGYFRFGSNLICYGRSCFGHSPDVSGSATFDALKHVRINQTVLALPFEPSQVVDNLRCEHYMRNRAPSGWRAAWKSLQRAVYYQIRPYLGVSFRRHLQRAALKDWRKIPFPKWPVDRTVDEIFEKLLALSMKAHGVDKIPFIWFWPDGGKSCAMMTHDVEESAGLDLCDRLMDVDASFELKSSFQIVPEKRYSIPPGFLDHLRNRGFEVNVHDLNHDGHLFDQRGEFLLRAKKINTYLKLYQTKGFRAGMLYRNLNWFDSFEFSYDMSVPNVGHLDPQRGGCCTIMPFFVQDILELPLTTTQDYSLFNILNDYTTELWERQVRIISENHGLVSFNVHPDYLNDEKSFDLYKALLGLLSRLRSEGKILWMLPSEVDRWWRDRSQMRIVREGGSWRIEGQNKERAQIAYAHVEGERVRYELTGLFQHV